jgi:hypothetical protein
MLAEIGLSASDLKVYGHSRLMENNLLGLFFLT